MTHRLIPALVALGAISIVTACSAGTAVTFEHALVDTACGPTGGSFPVLRLADAPIDCGAPASASSETLTARAGDIIATGGGVTRYEMVSGERCDEGGCSNVVGGWIERAVEPVSGLVDVTYRVELTDGTFAEGSGMLPVCERAACL